MKEVTEQKMKDKDKEFSCDVYKEALILMSLFHKDLVSKIPENVWQVLLEIAAESNKEFYFDVTKSLEEQNISEECKDIISLIYYNCVASSEDKKEIYEFWTKN